jgi:hypothetical protein
MIGSAKFAIESVHERFTVFASEPQGNTMFRVKQYVLLDNDDATQICKGTDLMALWREAVHKTKVKQDHLRSGASETLVEGAL